MAEITREYIAKKRAEYQHQQAILQGALLGLDEIERELFPPELTLDGLKQALGAAEIDEPQPV
jgi:hypothetical protein